VEDNQVFREALELLLGLRSMSRSSRRSVTARRRFEVAQSTGADVVLMDYRLPGLDGVEATRALREACPAWTVVCLTASANLRERDALLEAGAVRCLTKDQELDDIVAAIHEASADETDLAEHGDRRRLHRRLSAGARALPQLARRAAVRAFRRRELQGLRRARPEEFLRAAPHRAGAARRPRSPPRATSLAAFEELAGYERVVSLHISASCRGPSRARAPRRRSPAATASA